MRALLGWAREHGTLIGRTALRLGIIGRPGAPFHPRDLHVLHYLWLVEDIIRDATLFEKGGEELDKIYREAEKRRRAATAQAAVTDSDRANAAAQMRALLGM